MTSQCNLSINGTNFQTDVQNRNLGINQDSSSSLPPIFNWSFDSFYLLNIFQKCIPLQITNFHIPVKCKHSTSPPNQCKSFCTSLPHTILAPFQSILQFKPGLSKIYISDHLSFLFIILQWSPLVYGVKHKLNKTYPQCAYIPLGITFSPLWTVLPASVG